MNRIFTFLTLSILSISFVQSASEKRSNEIEENKISGYDQYIEFVKKLANDGVVSHQSELGRMHYFGEVNGKQDFENAFKWYQKAALNGDATSQEELAFMYSRGYGVEKNQEKATEWYKASAENGNGGANLDLANRYFSGKGIEKNCEKAIYWYKKASEVRFDQSIALRHLVKKHITSECVPKNLQEAYKYLLIYYKVTLHGECFDEACELKSKLTKDDILLAEQQADEWLRTYAPNKRF